MEKTTQQVYSHIDNDLYNASGDIWWQPNTMLNLLKTSVNPCRVNYFKNCISGLNMNPAEKTALEVGCGGGILTEEISKMGFKTTGMDPSENSLSTAIHHAQSGGLDIKYDKGTGENLPYADQSFDYVFCCDVLEHVMDLQKVISEISRVLKSNGVFFYDTLNRTFISKIVAIKI